MNMIDYNQAVEAIENERKLLLNREQYGAENVLVHHALNVIAELPIIRQPEIIRCKDCRKHGDIGCPLWTDAVEWETDDDWFCADGQPR